MFASLLVIYLYSVYIKPMVVIMILIILNGLSVYIRAYNHNKQRCLRLAAGDYEREQIYGERHYRDNLEDERKK